MAPTNKLAIADKCRFSSSSSLSSFVLPENDAIRWNNRCTMCVREFASVLCLCAFLESLLRTSKYSFDQRPSSKLEAAANGESTKLIRKRRRIFLLLARKSEQRVSVDRGNLFKKKWCVASLSLSLYEMRSEYKSS